MGAHEPEIEAVQRLAALEDADAAEARDDLRPGVDGIGISPSIRRRRLDRFLAANVNSARLRVIVFRTRDTEGREVPGRQTTTRTERAEADKGV